MACTFAFVFPFHTSVFPIFGNLAPQNDDFLTVRRPKLIKKLTRPRSMAIAMANVNVTNFDGPLILVAQRKKSLQHISYTHYIFTCLIYLNCIILALKHFKVTISIAYILNFLAIFLSAWKGQTSLLVYVNFTVLLLQYDTLRFGCINHMFN